MPSAEENLAHALVSLANNLVSDFDVVDLFYELVEITTELLAVDQAGLLLVTPGGDLRVMAVTNESAQIVELLQLQNGKGGPAVEAYLTGALVQEAFHSEATRWPDFSERSLSNGFGYMAAVPMRLGDDTIGALSLFRTDPHSLSERDLMAARALADVATIAIIQEQAARAKDLLVDQLQRALDSRMAIERAKGIVAEATGLSLDKAFELLRSYSRDHNERLREAAARVASGDLDPRYLGVG